MDISKKKPIYPISNNLKDYLKLAGRAITLPIYYEDLLRYSGGFPLLDAQGEDTLWETVMYDEDTIANFNKGLTVIYSYLRTDGDLNVISHLYVDRIDYCHFGNTKPFRIRIVNRLNDNYDYFYVKKADASRVYGLELEYILSPNRINFFVDKTTLIEEHIPGIPGDKFLDNYTESPSFNKVRIAKEFVKFNERCFVRLLGDMRSYNYVIDITPDFEDEQYRVRAIDFDQQCYEGRKTMYLPQFFKENLDVVEFCSEVLPLKTVEQYRYEERVLIRRRYETAKHRYNKLKKSMCLDVISSDEKITSLKKELSKYHKKSFSMCTRMGEVMHRHLSFMLTKERPKE
jgi:hypothetical protein